MRVWRFAMKDYLTVVGVMTGNSLDGADFVMTRFFRSGEIRDLASYSLASSPQLSEALRHVRRYINDCGADMPRVVDELKRNPSACGDFDAVEDLYTRFLARGVSEIISQAERAGDISGGARAIDVVGSHGQTCAHLPPSIARRDTSASSEVYSVQIGDAQKLADLCGITVIADFRSDDIMNGGEGAPIAPMHHRHLGVFCRKQGSFPIAFCNAGNTGNISLVTEDGRGELRSLGFDTGPFSDFTDKLTQRERGLACDHDGLIGARGKVNLSLLGALFSRSVRTKFGENFLLQAPPRSSDPQWYQMIPELLGEELVAGLRLSFEDRLRTAQYFSAYIYFFSLSFIPSDWKSPEYFAFCGGGWRNPNIRADFINLVAGNFDQAPLLLEHRDLLTAMSSRLTHKGTRVPECHDSAHYGFDGTSMEARMIADAAFCRVTGEPFSLPEITGVSSPTVLGVIRFANDDRSTQTDNLRDWLQSFKSEGITVDDKALFDIRWSRASSGWKRRLAMLKV